MLLLENSNGKGHRFAIYIVTKLPLPFPVSNATHTLILTIGVGKPRIAAANKELLN